MFIDRLCDAIRELQDLLEGARRSPLRTSSAMSSSRRRPCCCDVGLGARGAGATQQIADREA
jgi:hypothetical protein